jgi:hypothetical protein
VKRRGKKAMRQRRRDREKEIPWERERNKIGKRERQRKTKEMREKGRGDIVAIASQHSNTIDGSEQYKARRGRRESAMLQEVVCNAFRT